MYLQRFYRQIKIIDAGQSRATGIPRSHNFAGFPEGVAGPELLRRMKQHLERVHGCVMPGLVTAIKYWRPGMFEVQLGQDRLLTRNVILYTGVEDQAPTRSGLAARLGAQLDGLGDVVTDTHCCTSVKGRYAADDVVSA